MRKEIKKNAVWLIEGEDLDSFEYVCPKCGGPAPYNYDGEQIASRFCPSCGKRLDKPQDCQMLVIVGPDGLPKED